MSEFYVLKDMDNRDEDQRPFEVKAPTLAEFVGYVDGPLRSDVREEARESVDEAIDALRRENFPLAQQWLRELGVYLSLEARGEHE